MADKLSSVSHFYKDIGDGSTCEVSRQWYEEAKTKLAAYEDAEEQGLLVRVPEEGEIVFFIEGFGCGACQQWHYRVREDRFDRFMRFFLTRAEAEAALSKEANDVRPT